VEALRRELARLLDAQPEDRELFYEYNSNESTDPDHVLFHALGAWRVASGFHDLLWHPAFTVPASQLLGGAVRFWHDQLFRKPGAKRPKALKPWLLRQASNQQLNIFSITCRAADAIQVYAKQW
jgi:hypothetical protein